MTAVVTHAFVSAKPASLDATKVDGPKWNDDHVLTTTITVKTTAGPFTVTDEQVLVLNKASPSSTIIYLPAVASYGDGYELEIFDWAGNAGDITISPLGAEKINGLASWTVGSGGSAGTGGSFKLRASTALSGWIAR